MIENGEFIEWAQVFTRRYGTGWRSVQRQLEAGIDVLLDIDVQGGLQIREKIPNAVLIFLLPPSMEELRRRLVNRAEDTARSHRAASSPRRVTRSLQSQAYDYLVVNDDFDQAEIDLRAIIRAHHIARNPPTPSGQPAACLPEAGHAVRGAGGRPDPPVWRPPKTAGGKNIRLRFCVDGLNGRP